MSLSKVHRQEIKNKLLKEIGKTQFYKDFSVAAFADSCGLSRQAIHKYLTSLEADSLIKKLPGNNNYRLVGTNRQYIYSIDNLQESTVWDKDISPLLHDIPRISKPASGK